jgi:hypothetical protein
MRRIEHLPAVLRIYVPVNGDCSEFESRATAIADGFTKVAATGAWRATDGFVLEEQIFIYSIFYAAANSAAIGELVRDWQAHMFASGEQAVLVEQGPAYATVTAQ